MRVLWLCPLVLLIPVAAFCSPKKSETGNSFMINSNEKLFINSNSKALTIGDATIDASYPMTFQLGHKRAAIIDDKGVHLTSEVDFDGHRIATVDDIERVKSECYLAHREADGLSLALICAMAFACSTLGALLTLATTPIMFAKTFTMRRWIMRAERARQKREAEQGALR